MRLKVVLMCICMCVCVYVRVCAHACGGGEQFFSRQLLFGRFDNDEPVMASLYPAFKEYLDYYNAVIKVFRI